MSIPLCMYISECCVIHSPTQLIISLLLTLADRQHVSALYTLLYVYQSIYFINLRNGIPIGVVF
jgi:hypothetical protein